MAVGWGAKCAKVLLIVFNLIFWLMGIGLLIFGIWVLVDPQRSYLLELVSFSEQDPLLKIAAYLFIGVGCFIIVIGFLGCCGALKEVQCMLCAYVIFLALILCAELAAGVLAVVFKDKFTSKYMQVYLYNKTHNQYGRQQWVTDLIDTVQYYINKTLHDDLGTLVSRDYGKENSSANLVIDKLQFYQKCCGSVSPQDYDGSWWQVNIPQGAKRYVPESCCRQEQDARPPNKLHPRDANCQIYAYDDGDKFRDAVHTEGCHEKLLRWFDHHAVIFIGLGISFAVFQLFGIMFSICLCRSVGDEI